MSDREKKQFNSDDLSDVKALIGDAQAGSYSLDDILAEYGTRRSTQRSAVPVRPAVPAASRGKVVTFPGAVQTKPAPPEPQQEEPEESQEQETDTQSREDEEELEDDAEAETEIESEPEEEDSDKVVAFPEEESVLSSFLKDLGRKADHYADHMFQESEEMDEEEVRRLEELIPGTDQEDEEEAPGRARPAFHFRRLRRPEPVPPDTSPQELARTYGKGIKALRLRGLLVFLLLILSVVQLAIPAAGFYWLPPLDDFSVQAWGAFGMLCLGFLLSADVLIAGLGRMFRGRVGMDTMAALAVIFTLADAAALAMTQNREGQLPYAAAGLAQLFFLLHGTYHKKCGLRLTCRTAAASSQPYLLTLDEGKWNGKDTYCKWSGEPHGFGSQIQMDDGAQRIYRRYCPLLLLGCVLLSIMVSVGMASPSICCGACRPPSPPPPPGREPGLCPALPQGGPPPGSERRGPGRLVWNGPVPKGRPGGHHRWRPVSPGLCGVQRHQGLWRLLH